MRAGGPISSSVVIDQVRASAGLRIGRFYDGVERGFTVLVRRLGGPLFTPLIRGGVKTLEREGRSRRESLA